MPWKTTSKEEQRYDLVRQMRAGIVSVVELCRWFRISRQTAYRWRQRFQAGRLAGLKDRSHRPNRIWGRTRRLWLDRLWRLRHQRPAWGARKLRHRLGQKFGWAGLPGVATLSRWLKRWGLAVGRRRRKPGPVVIRRAVRKARRCNEVWTADFKGWYRTGDGRRVDPLTVRDLYSRYGLRIGLLDSPSVAQTRREFVRLFRQYGLPERIRCDNGTPFGGVGPTGLTRLSAWWIKLGIKVDFMTPGRPCENGAHEQFHRVYQAEVASQPAGNRRAQQRRSNQWLQDYNHVRPHEALGMNVPAQYYRRSSRRLPARITHWKYDRRWERRWVKGNGEISWHGTWRYVGEAFVRDYVGLKPLRQGVWKVYFGPVLVGELQESELGSIRLAQYRHKKPSSLGSRVPARSARLHSATQPKVSRIR
jgi:putative transposase